MSLDIPAPADQVWALAGHVRRNGVGPVYSTPCRVVVCDPDREFAFVVGEGLTRWGYRLEPTDSGTRVTEYFTGSQHWTIRLYWALADYLCGLTTWLD